MNPTPSADLRRNLRAAGRKARTWTERRDALILEAHAAGLSSREIGAAAGLSHTAVRMTVGRLCPAPHADPDQEQPDGPR